MLQKYALFGTWATFWGKMCNYITKVPKAAHGANM